MNKLNLYSVLRCALADLEGLLPQVDPSGNRQHSGWKTIEEIRALLADSKLELQYCGSTDYKGYTIELDYHAKIYDETGSLFSTIEVYDSFDQAQREIDEYIARVETKEVLVNITKPELDAIRLAWECMRDGIIDTEFDKAGFQRFHDAAVEAFGGAA